MSAASRTLETRPSNSLVDRRSKFAAGIALGMLAVNLVGFGPTLYLRPFFDVPAIPGYLYVHGAIGSGWFILLVVQTLLVANHRVKVHRQLGWVGAALATSVLLSGLYTSTNMVSRNVALGLTTEADIALYSVVTAADRAAFVVFPTLVLLAVWFRRRADVHKRLMLIASLSILGPAVARIASWYGPFPNPVSIVLIWSFIAALLIHDVMSRRRPHVATVLALLFFLAVNVGMQLSGVGPALVEQRMEQAYDAD
jgi:hypothetical protein